MKSWGPHDGIRPLKEETRKITSSLPLHAHAQKEGYVRMQREGGNPRESSHQTLTLLEP